VDVLRILNLDDADELAAVRVAERDRLAPYEPEREASFFTAEGQREELKQLIAAHAAGLAYPFGVVVDGRLVGALTLTGVVRRAFMSCSVGYWMSERFAGHGVMTRALGEATTYAFDHLGLHRVEAATLLDNVASQRVLAKNGFERFGQAPQYLHIAGRWQDHVLFQRLAPAS
jgi:ribosomal-protein-alanine N-acetyltransferase